MNRIASAVEEYRKLYESSEPNGQTFRRMADERSSSLNVDAWDLVQYQETKSMAMLDGLITTDEAATMYQILGESPEHFNNRPFWEKMAVTLAIKEILGHRIRKQGGTK